MRAKLCACLVKRVVPMKPFCGEKEEDDECDTLEDDVDIDEDDDFSFL